VYAEPRRKFHDLSEDCFFAEKRCSAERRRAQSHAKSDAESDASNAESLLDLDAESDAESDESNAESPGYG
jgi:hypothetical protein